MTSRIVAVLLFLGCALLQYFGAPLRSWVMLAVGGAMALAAVFVTLFYDRVVVVAPGPFCTNCEYDLTAVEGAVCPECGAARSGGSITQ